MDIYSGTPKDQNRVKTDYIFISCTIVYICGFVIWGAYDFGNIFLNVFLHKRRQA